MTLLEQLESKGATNLHVDGKWREASDGGRFEVLDPSTGETLTSVSNGTKEDALAAVSAASQSKHAFASVSPQERSEILRRSFEIMMSWAEGIAELIVLEMGKSLNEARSEVAYAAEFFRWFSGEAVRNLGYVTMAPGGDKRILAIHQPIGVSLLITPWNFPAAMAARKIAPAVAAGCTMVLKPASDTPLTALAVACVLEEAGLPKGVLNVLPSRQSAAVVEAMLADQRVQNLSFTGSTEVGRRLLELAAKRVVRCSMELGGNAPLIVLDDADLDVAVDGAMIAKMRNGGQSCIAANRIYAQAPIADSFAQRLSEAMGSIIIGPGLHSDVDLGPLVNESAVEDMVGYVEAATARGSKVLSGGSRLDRPGYFFPPTLLTDVDRSDPLLSTEIFGPLAPIVLFETDDEAIELANATIHGLAGYVFTGSLGRGLRVAEALEVGMVGINRGAISDPAAPFGGRKQSGLGREGSHEGLMEFLETKYIAVDW